MTKTRLSVSLVGAVILGLATFLVVKGAIAHTPGDGGKKQEHAQNNTTNNKPLGTQAGSGEQANTAQNQPHDWHYWKEAFYPGTWSNWALAVLAGWAGYMALSTLRVIEGQSSIMVNKERARLNVEVDPLQQFEINQQSRISEIKFRVVYYGTTEAFKVTTQVWVEIRDDSDSAPSAGAIGTNLRIPRVIAKDTILEDQRFTISPPLTGDLLQSVQNGEKFVHFFGWIRYTDIFDKQRETGFYFTWSKTLDPRHPMMSVDRWLKRQCEGYDQET